MIAGAVALASLMLGFLFGYSATRPIQTELDALKAENSAAVDTSESLRDTSDSLRDEVAGLEEEIERLSGENEQLNGENEQLETQVDQLDERELELDQREAGLDSRETGLDDIEAGLDAREEDLTQTEAEIEANTIPGDGIWVVGDEIQPGVYKAQGSGSGCYWARLNSLDGFDIISNHFGSANVSVEIHSGDAAFETSGCGSWVKQ